MEPANLRGPPSAFGGANWDVGYAFIIVKHIRVLHTTGSQVTCSMWLGDSGTDAASTEVVCAGMPIAPHDFHDCYGAMRINAGRLLTGKASATGLTATCDGEIGMMALSQAAIDTELSGEGK